MRPKKRGWLSGVIDVYKRQQPRRNEIGVYGFVKYDICRLHNLLYHEGRNQTANAWEDDPWA